MEIDERSELIKNFQLKKRILWGIGIFAVFLVMLYFDKQKVYMEEKPPIPTIGDSSFTKPFKSTQNDDFKLVDSISIQKSLKLGDGNLIDEQNIYVFNNRELIFQTRDYENLLKFLFEAEQLLPVKKEMIHN
ncbi:hypothetical protein DFO73_101875 [Cytobacillus oceanisediminis]|uniref:Uncharacterized protein n=1 Tax=Cytobacillus oceanisediminis TaxID=665099 RepID=A0A2V3A976_9BACI|nr:hypothetical protein [Cytobacillus oceanisediminis]PWW32610.1 hypothetical protein DFO73_101875 [Cytobacillus oceanisediminis]